MHIPAPGAEAWSRIAPHLDRALDLEPHEREAWIAELTATQPDIANAVRAMLAERDLLDADEFLEHSPFDSTNTATRAGARIGAYAIDRLIGRGGMGEVWLARRDDGRFEGECAIKFLAGYAVRGKAAERFLREGRLLARLTHPNITRLLDAGTTDEGRPYLVLEYVDGEPIDCFCDRRDSSIEARLRLFLDVLGAVTHAQNNLVVHRDLKPSNVLVAAGGTVKLLDFGIAKLLEDTGSSNVHAPVTREGVHALTPEYAAPEQLTNIPLTTATDVYALGVLLYTLLSGQHPLGKMDRAPLDLAKAIVEEEPKRLSLAVTSADICTIETLDEHAARRGMTRQRLSKILRGDLDNIVAKALKKQAHERYASAAAFADDLRRYLNQQPVSAQPDSLTYRTSKFVRRNFAAVALTTLTAVAMLAGLVGTISQARRATEQAARANAQRDFALRQLSRAEAINDLNAFLLSDAAPSGQPFTVGQLLKRAEDIVARQHATNADIQLEMLGSIGRLYSTLDEQGHARRVLSHVYEESRRSTDLSTRAKASCGFAAELFGSGESDRAEQLIRDALAELPDEPNYALDRIFCLWRGSEIARDTGDADKGVERAVAAQQLLERTPLASPLLEMRVRMNVAEANRIAAHYPEAIHGFEKAFEQLVALGYEDTQRAGTLLNNWAQTLQEMGQPLKAEELFRQAIRISSANDTEAQVSPMLLNNLARTLFNLERLPEALDYAQRAYHTAMAAGDDLIVNQTLLVRARVHLKRGEGQRVAALVAEAQPRFVKMYPAGSGAFASLALLQSALAQSQRDMTFAQTKMDEAMRIAEASGESGYFVPRVLLDRCAFQLDAGRLDAAVADATSVLDTYRRQFGSETPSSYVGSVQLTLGRALQAQGHAAKARAAFGAALTHLQQTVGPNHSSTQLAAQLVGTDP